MPPVQVSTPVQVPKPLLTWHPWESPSSAVPSQSLSNPSQISAAGVAAEQLRHLGLLLVEGEAVLEAGTAAGTHTKAQSQRRVTFGRYQLGDFGRSCGAEGSGGSGPGDVGFVGDQWHSLEWILAHQ